MIFGLPLPPAAPADLAEVGRMLRSPDATERRSAVRAIREREIHALYAAVFEVAGDPDPWVRWEIAGTLDAPLRKLNATVDSREIDDAGEEKVERLRLALNRLKPLSETRNAKDPFRLGTALPAAHYALTLPDDRLAVSLIQRAIAETQPYEADLETVPFIERCGTGRLLARQGMLNFLSEHRPDLVANEVRRTMETDPERVWVASYLSSRCLDRFAESEWRKWLGSPWPQVRAVAAEHAALRFSRRTMWPDLRRRLEDPSAEVRVLAMRALLAIDTARAYPLWVRRVEASEGDELSALLEAGRESNLARVPTLRRLLQKGSSAKRRVLADALGFSE
ncbi:MAG: HEAT repeat domain-containing protein [Fimbriimonas sp.]